MSQHTSKIKDAKISLVLCTCNSEKYIGAQLESILTQTKRPDEIIVSDDVSEDQTLTIIDQMLRDSGIDNKIIINQQRMGFVKNFEAAIKVSSGQYITLCDHDDVWRPEKTQLLYEAILEQERLHSKEMPVLSFCDSSLATESLEIYEPSFIKSTCVNSEKMLKSKYSLSIQNIVTGMCSMFNRKLAETALPMPESVAVHDWWLALVAQREGKIAFVNKPLVLYRQHGHNSLGAGQDVGLAWPRQIKGMIKLGLIGALKNLKERAIMYRNSYQIRIPHLLKLYERTNDKEYLFIAHFFENGGIKRLPHILSLGATPLPYRARIYFCVMFAIYPLCGKVRIPRFIKNRVRSL